MNNGNQIGGKLLGRACGLNVWQLHELEQGTLLPSASLGFLLWEGLIIPLSGLLGGREMMDVEDLALSLAQRWYDGGLQMVMQTHCGNRVG